jgi:serine/threonine-protein kinase
VGATVAGFELEAELGRGGYGVVFRARRGGRLYAVKFIYLPYAEGWGWREVEVMLRLRQLGGVQLEGCGRWPDARPLFLYIAMEYVRGQPLYAWAEATNPTARQVAGVVLALARELVVVHAAGVVHRDIKGANVLVREGTERPVLVDFGLGTCEGARQVSAMLLPGSFHYRSPEALHFRREHGWDERYPATPGDDLWALGVVLYWLLTDRYPFDERHADLQFHAIRTKRPEAPRALNPRVPEALEALCLRMLEKAPEARYADARALCAALEEVLAGADAAWEVPLCETYGPDTVTTPVVEDLDIQEGVARWERLADFERHHPRRGGPPSQEPPTLLPTTSEVSPVPEVPTPEVAAPEVAAPEVQQEGTGPEASEPPRARAVPWRAVVGALVLLAVVALWILLKVTSPVAPGSPTREVTAGSGQEVAFGGWSLEGEGGAAPPWAPTPAPVASATHSEETRVKTPQQAPTPEEKQPRKQTARTLAAATAACAVLSGCPGPVVHSQVRPKPPPEDCPPGSLEAMEQLGLRMGDNEPVFLAGEDLINQVATVREGPGVTVEVRRSGGWGKLMSGSVVTGRFIFGEGRVYGRFTQVRTTEGKTYPVCMQLADEGSDLGIEMKSRSGTDTAIIWTDYGLMPVKRFE